MSDRPVIRRIYSAIGELISDAGRAHAEGRVHRGSDSHGVCRAGFVGRPFESWADCAGKANQTWTEGVTILEALLDQLAHVKLPEPSSRARKIHFSENGGDEIDLDRLQAGDSAYWRETHRENVKAPQTVSIFCNIAAPAFIGSRHLFWRGACGIALADLLGKAGFTTELYLVDYTSHAFRSGYDLFQCTTLKTAGQPLDKATIVNAMSGWFFRSVGFQARHATKGQVPKDNLGYAQHLDGNNPELKGIAGPGSTVIAIDGIFDMGRAIDRIEEAVRELGAEQPAE
jgi:hypothetical protein